MTVLAELTIPSDAFMLGQVLGTPGAQIEVLQTVSAIQTSLPYVRITGEYDATAFEHRVRNDERIERLTAVGQTFQTSLYRLEWADELNGLFSIIQEHGLIIEAASGTTQHWTLNLRAPDQAAIEAVRQDCHSTDIPITSLTIIRRTDGFDGRPYNLTPKQREALRLAFERGYFTVPREVSLTELADELDISRQAFTRRLHRGLYGILAVLFEE